MALFNIRVYGLLINQQHEVLVSDENIRGNYITKFPGGGLEFGEGTIDCIEREFIEELNTPIEVIRHFYTTDFYQQSAFNPEHQIVSIYYLVKAIDTINSRIATKPFDFDKDEDQATICRWIPIDKITEDDVSLAIDKVVVGMLLTQIL